MDHHYSDGRPLNHRYIDESGDEGVASVAAASMVGANHKKTRSFTENDMSQHNSSAQNRLTSRRFSAHPPSPLVANSDKQGEGAGGGDANTAPDNNEKATNLTATTNLANEKNHSNSLESMVNYKDALNDVPKNGGVDEEECNQQQQRRQLNPPNTLNLQAVNNNNCNMMEHLTSSPSNSPVTTTTKSIVSEQNNKTPTKSAQDQESSPKRSRKKKRTSASWYNVLSPTYRQKNEHFHKFFKEIPENERLLVDASCALVNDILVQGRLYVSQHYVCFHSNFLKWQKAVVIKFDECTKITKEKLAKIFPNSICFQTETRGKQLFTSFTSRDRTFAVISKIWQLSKNDEPMTSQQLWDNVREQYGSDLGCSSDSDYVKADSADEKRSRKKKSSKKKSKTLEETDTTPQQQRQQEPSQNGENNTSLNANSEAVSLVEDSQVTDGEDEGDMLSEEQRASPNNFVGALSTEFADSDPTPSEHPISNLSHVYMDEKYQVSACQLFNILFGDNNGNFYKQYLLNNKQAHNVKFGTWSAPSSGSGKDGGSQQGGGNRTRVHDYVVPLNHPLGPKSSRIVEEQILYNISDPGRTYAVDAVTQNYNIPYSDYFQTIIRYSIRKLSVRSSELRVSASIKFLKDPWGMVKSFIEKNAYAGIQENFQLLSVELRNFVNENCDKMPKLTAKETTTTTTTSEEQSNTIRQRRNKQSGQTNHLNADGKNTDDKTQASVIEGTTTNNDHHRIQTSSLTSPSPPSSANYNILTSIKQLAVDKCKKIAQLKTSKLMSIFFTFMIALLLFNNYSMHRRLMSLESQLRLHQSSNKHTQPPSLGVTSSSTSHSDDVTNDLLRDVILRLDRLEASWTETRKMWLGQDRKWSTMFDKISKTSQEDKVEELEENKVKS